jgi:hypothetical protein
VYAIRTGDDVADAQVAGLPDAQAAVLAELYDVLRLTPGNGRLLVSGGNMLVWDYRGCS